METSPTEVWLKAKPMPVTIVRPKMTVSAALGRLAAKLVLLAADAWIVMVVASAVFGYHFSYWHAIVFLLAVRVLQINSADDLSLWSSSFADWKKAKA